MLLFDVFGTLVDWRTSVAEQLSEFGRRHRIAADWSGLADDWRAHYQPSMEAVRRGQRPWVPLDVLNRESLAQVLADHGLEHLDASLVAGLERVWHRLRPWPDTVRAWERLGRRATLVSLSNADVAMATAIADHAGLGWHAVLGAEPARAYKPQPAVYLHAVATIGIRPEQAMMVAAHNRDLEAASRLGIRTALVLRPNEHGPGQTSDLAPTGEWDVVCDDLIELADVLDGRRPRAPVAVRQAPSLVEQARPEPPVADVGLPSASPGGQAAAGGLGATDLARVRLVTIAIALSLAVALAFQQGYATGTNRDADTAPDRPPASPTDASTTPGS